MSALKAPSQSPKPTLTAPALKHAAPIFILWSLAGFYFIAYQMIASKAPDRFLEVHEASKVPLHLTGGRIPIIDKALDPLISFFVAAFLNPNTPAYPTVVDFVWSFGGAIQMPLIEWVRDVPSGSSGSLPMRLISNPMIWGILYQRLSGGWIIPLWLLAFMYAPTRLQSSGIRTWNAQSVFVGWWVGHTLPALKMLIPGLPAFEKTPMWVAFPIMMSLAQEGWIFLRKPIKLGASQTQRNTDGYVWLNMVYLSSFCASAMAHVHLVILPSLSKDVSVPASAGVWRIIFAKLVTLLKDLYTFFIPATGLRVPSPAQTTAVNGVVHFVQFDILVVFGAVWTAALWDLLGRITPRSQKERAIYVAKAVALLLGTGLLIGPGAATAGLMAWRESYIAGVNPYSAFSYQ